MSDRLYVLDQFTNRREVFDPANQDHLAEVKYYMDNRRWRNGCPFYLQHPYVEIPAMIANKFLEHAVK